jgi:hypothetical protein
VARVGHQVALSLDRALERVECGVEGAREPPEFVRALGLDALRGIAVCRQLLGAPREARHRRERGACHEGAEGRAEGHSRRSHEQEHQHHAVELAINLVERACELHSAPIARTARENAQVGAVDRRVGEVLARSSRRDLACTRAHGDRLVAPRPPQHATRREHELGDPLRSTERLRPRHWDPSALRGPSSGSGRPWSADNGAGFAGRIAGPHPAGESREHAGAVAQRAIHLPTELGAHAEVDGRRGHEHDHRHREPGGCRDAGPQAHGSRRT